MKKALVLVGFFAGMLLGAPVASGVGALFWSSSADTNDAQRVATQLYKQTQLNPAAQADRPRFHQQTCGQRAFERLEAGDITLMDALRRYRRDLLRSKYDKLAINSLTTLPAPVLGALNGCANGSPASPLCLSYVRNVADRSAAIPATIQKAWFAEVDHQIDKAWCAVNPN